MISIHARSLTGFLFFPFIVSFDLTEHLNFEPGRRQVSAKRFEKAELFSLVLTNVFLSFLFSSNKRRDQLLARAQQTD